MSHRPHMSRPYMSHHVTNIDEFKRVTPNDIVYHVAKLKTSRSGKIPTRFLKNGVKCIAQVLSSLFNESMESGVFPDI